MKITLFTTNCPKCKILEAKLNTKNIEYCKCEDIEQMASLGIQSAPYLSVEDSLLDYYDAVKWVNSKED